MKYLVKILDGQKKVGENFGRIKNIEMKRANNFILEYFRNFLSFSTKIKNSYIKFSKDEIFLRGQKFSHFSLTLLAI